MPLDFDLSRRTRYSQGAGILRLLPEAVARPATIAELRAAIAGARDAGLAITPRGAGTAMDGSNIGHGAVLDLTRFDANRCVIDPAARVANVSPSLTLRALAEATGALHLRLPPDPSSSAWATVGGVVSTNAAGARSARFGSVRRWVRGLSLETMDGPLALERGVPVDPAHPVARRWADDAEPYLLAHADAIVARFPAVRKNSAGYALDRWYGTRDLIDIVIGSEGTLGVITSIALALDSIPEHRSSLRLALAHRADLPAIVEAVRALDPSTIEFLDASFLRVARPHVVTPDAPGLLDEARGLLLVDFEGATSEEVADRAHAARRAAGRVMHASVATSPADIEALWAVRHGASPALAALTDGRRSLQVIEDACVPVDRLPGYLDLVDAACARAGIDVVMFGHAGDGHVHVNVLPDLDQPGWLDALRLVYAEVSAAVIAMGGTVSGEHGTGRLRAPLMPAQYGDTVMEAFRRVKQTFDPHDCCNPGVILGSDDPFAAIKVGVSAPAIDTELSGWLADLERSARWGADRW